MYERSANIGDSSPAMTKRKKIILGVLTIVIGLLVALILTAFACFSIMDKTNGTIVSSGVTRRYLLYVPKTYDRSKPTPLILSFHPGATWPAVEKNISRWNDLADEHGFIVVYPEGSGFLFGGLGPGPQIWPGEPEDVKFISDLIAKLQGAYNIDANRIYVNGMSNGGGMAFQLTCELPGRFAAVGVVSGAYPQKEDPCGNYQPVAAVMFHGTGDKIAPYQGGRSPIAPFPFANIPDWTAHVAQRNQCKGDPIETRISPSVRRLAYANCAENADVILFTIEGGGHTWPGGKHLAEWIAGRTTEDINASRVMWEFFAQHPREPK